MAIIRITLLVAAAVALSACSTQVTMQNAQGQQVACKGGGASAGATSSRVKDDLLTECVDRYRFQGYEIVAVRK